MLQELRIRNFALLEEVRLPFGYEPKASLLAPSEGERLAAVALLEQLS
jgi:hypothetical protein